MNTTPRMHHLRPMLTGRTSRRQHMARPVTVDGRSWTWVSLCGVPVDPTYTESALRRHRGHTGRTDCASCTRLVREGRMYPDPTVARQAVLRAR